MPINYRKLKPRRMHALLRPNPSEVFKVKMEYELIGISENIKHIKKLINRVATTGLNVLVCGETGVGKEVVVHRLYQMSNRNTKPLIKVNCAALPGPLLESEMFGYEPGAFTGAERRKPGKVEQAQGGLLFLDEIGDMSLPLQSKLLHVLEGGDFTPLGSEKPVKTDAWVISATNHNLEEDMQKGVFRKDLYYRLSNVRVYIEPLRKRLEDIPYLIDHFIKEYENQFKGKKLQYPSRRIINRMTTYHWPGNVRELQNILKRIMILGEGEETIDILLNPTRILGRGRQFQSAGVKSSIPIELWGMNGEKAPDLNSLSLKKVRKKALDRVEKEVISYVLVRTDWNRSKASKILNISYKTLLTKIKELNIHPLEDSTLVHDSPFK
jgi:two-component system response regulator AtoC